MLINTRIVLIYNDCSVTKSISFDLLVVPPSGALRLHVHCLPFFNLFLNCSFTTCSKLVIFTYCHDCKGLVCLAAGFSLVLMYPHYFVFLEFCILWNVLWIVIKINKLSFFIQKKIYPQAWAKENFWIFNQSFLQFEYCRDLPMLYACCLFFLSRDLNFVACCEQVRGAINDLSLSLMVDEIKAVAVSLRWWVRESLKFFSQLSDVESKAKLRACAYHFDRIILSINLVSYSCLSHSGCLHVFSARACFASTMHRVISLSVSKKKNWL
jgi:hypothetical protein